MGALNDTQVSRKAHQSLNATLNEIHEALRGASSQIQVHFKEQRFIHYQIALFRRPGATLCCFCCPCLPPSLPPRQPCYQSPQRNARHSLIHFVHLNSHTLGPTRTHTPSPTPPPAPPTSRPPPCCTLRRTRAPRPPCRRHAQRTGPARTDPPTCRSPPATH
jgi:hypothetical protein